MVHSIINTSALIEDLEQELNRILQYWIDYTIDEENGGFIGEIDTQEHVIPNAQKGLVLNSRILWSFSSAALKYPNPDWEMMADRAFHYVASHFVDRTYGGAYWALNADGTIADGKKQTYGIAFCIYGLSEYVKLTNSEEALLLAKQLYEAIEAHCIDPVYKGYFEAFAEDWELLSDVRLSDKDENTPKTTNTHLHVVEAYANLYQVWPDTKLADRIRNILLLFNDHIIDKDTGHLKLFFTNEWQSTLNEFSFGHDIETAWLLQHCASVLNDSVYRERFEQLAILMTKFTTHWLDDDGSLYYEINVDTGVVNKEKHWWVQAEASIGLFNAWQLTGNYLYLKLFERNWVFIETFIVDKKHGEWYWGVTVDNELMKQPKVGFWKCPYHNTRACLELLKRLQTVDI